MEKKEGRCTVRRNAFDRLQIVRGLNSSYFGSWAYVVDNISSLGLNRYAVYVAHASVGSTS